ncbi:MAG: DUF1080 domain-containing protein [Candidatus Hydrogenedentes bacterium]|nr:DUF1080 domain-containing protein [Candidatus Hydrogenedentota bacterium]
MKTSALIVLSVVAFLCSAALAAPGEEGFVSMFNGKDLSGWDGKPGGWWVEDGALTSENPADKPIPKHHYLFWEGGTPGDFILRFQFKLEGGNSGVQIRSERRPDYDVWGYQADMDEAGDYTGCLYQHDRGVVVLRGMKTTIHEDGTRTEEQVADPAELLKVVKPHEWNEYEVTADGPHLTLSINGKLMCEAWDHDKTYSRKEGVIALQMHPGPPMKVQYKDLRIKLLNAHE